MAVKKITKTSSSSSSTSLPKKPRCDAKWRAMMKRRNAIMKKGPCITKTSSSSSSTRSPKQPRRDAKWRGMMKRRNAIMKRGTIFEILKEAAAGCILETSHGVAWFRCCLLGKGGCGSVFLAKRRTTSSDDLPDKIAVKSATLEKASTLKHEKRVLCDLTASPNVIKCYGDEITDIFNGQRIYNILLEFCCGLSLHHHISLPCSGLPEFAVRKYTRDVVKGLKYVHSRGYIHCDVKPANILLVPGTEERSGCFVAKIADFGLAMSIYEDQNWGNDLIGTYRYMSPELVKEKRYEYGVDIWALGCTVLEMLSGNSVWPDMDVPGYLYTIGYSDDLPQMPSAISDDAKDFLGKCLVRNAAQRWSAEKLLEHPFLSVD